MPGLDAVHGQHDQPAQLLGQRVRSAPRSGRGSTTGSTRPRQLTTPASHGGHAGTRLVTGTGTTSATSAMATAYRAPPNRTTTAVG